jgi:D-glycerate 3-kinase
MRRPGRDGQPALIGVAGSQGSGKTTLVRAAARASGAAAFSLDDVYRTKAERQRLAREAHPLFETRGVPGTHDLELAEVTIEALRAGGRTPLPSFDKLADDRRPMSVWPVVEGRPAAIVFDGWCVGATPQAEDQLTAPINDLEARDDADGAWRRAVNTALAGPYAAFFGRFDAILFLAAPSWRVVLDWRAEQEAGLMGITPAELPTERRAQLARFIAFYERITRHMLAGGVTATATARLRDDRSVGSIS